MVHLAESSWMIEAQESHSETLERPAPSGSFPQTRWSLVAAAGSDQTASRQALERLCRDYWLPLYTYLRIRGCSVEDAQDLTQTLFSNLIERGSLDGQQITRAFDQVS